MLYYSSVVEWGGIWPKGYEKCMFCRPSVINEETVTLKRGGYCFERRMEQISFQWGDAWYENIWLNIIFCDVLWYKFYTTVVILFFVGLVS